MTESSAWSLSFLSILLFFAAFSTGGELNTDGRAGREERNWGTEVVVTEVIDGDTIRVQSRDVRIETVRLIGVDTPEVHVENQPDAFEGIESARHLRAWGKRASEFVRKRLLGERVRMDRDPGLENRGYYGRLLRYIRINGRPFNLKLIRKGFARHYESPSSKRKLFHAAESHARQRGAGLWKRVE